MDQNYSQSQTPGISMFQGIGNIVITGGKFKLDNSSHHHWHHDYQVAARSPEFIRRLRPPHDVKDLLVPNRQARLHKTCLWSIENPFVRAWLDPQDPLRRLWVFGRPGTGKSVLAAFLIDRVLQEHNIQEEITLYYFCKNKNDTPVHVLKDFIRQFLQQKDSPTHPDIADFVMEIFSQRIEYEFSMQEIEPYFLKFLGLFKRHWFIVDGLDECQEPGALIRALGKFPDSKILMLSRKERYIEIELADWEKLEIGTPSTTGDDLGVFIKDRVANLVEKYRFLHAESQRIQDTIFDKSAGMFQYAYVVCETLQQQTSHAAITRTIETIPSDLMDLYSDYLSQRLQANSKTNNEVALRALQWIVHSPQPLSSKLLGQALVVDLAQENGTVDPEFIGDIKSRISDALGILVDWHESEKPGSYFAHVGHQSIREYFLNLKSETDEVSKKDSNNWWGALNLPHSSLLSPSAHSVILSTCVIVMKRAEIWEAFREYHNTADKRRELCPTDRQRLDKQLCRNETWTLWETKQLEYLEKDRIWRKAEAAFLHANLREVTDEKSEGDLEWVQNARNRLEIIDQAEHPLSTKYEHMTLTRILSMRERELMVHALQHVGRHLAETGAFGDKLLMDAFSELIPQWRGYACHILCQIETTFVPAGPKDLYTRDLIIALESFSTILEVVERLRHSRSTNIVAVLWLLFVSHLALASDSPTSLVWNAEITKSLESSQPPRRLRHMFSLVTNLIISLNNIELAVFDYDTGVKPLIGTGIFLHSVWYCKQTLAQWMVSQEFSHLDPQRALLQSDDYLFPKLLLAVPAVSHPPLHFPEKSVFSSPSLVPTLLAFAVLGYSNFWILQVAFLCVHLALSRMRRYSFVPPRQLFIHLGVAKCCLLFLFAVQSLPLPRTATLVIITLLPAVGIYNNLILEKFMRSLHLRLQFVVYWAVKNPDFTLSLCSTCAACALTQLNTAIIYLLFEHAIHATVDPYRLHYVLRLYSGLEGSSSDLSVRVEGNYRSDTTKLGIYRGRHRKSQ